METISTIAALKRLPVGTRLRLVNCLMGPTNKPRVIKQVRSRDILMDTPEGQVSYLTLGGVTIEATENGFKLFEKEKHELCAEYVFEGN
jgi:hypothetical protein